MVSRLLPHRTGARRRLAALGLPVLLVAAACTSGDVVDDAASPTTGADDASESTTSAPTTPPDTGPITVAPGEAFEIGPAPETPSGPVDDDLLDALELLRTASLRGGPAQSSIDTLVQSGDARFAWPLSDLLRFLQGDGQGDALADAIEELTGTEIDPARPWNSAVNQLIAWDLPATPDYGAWKAGFFAELDPRWGPLLDDADSLIDARWLNWGGVLIDDRELNQGGPCPRGCIPALDDPVTTDAAGGDWYPDDAIVFGVVIDGEARAYPKNQMEVHEMVNDTLGGRRFGMPYCTLCGSAQVFFTDGLDAVADRPPVLRTSGLLSRSNKVMYDLDSASVFDTFTGEAVTGPLLDAGVVLPQGTVVTTTWAEWKAAHPQTTILAEDGGEGRTYPLDPLNGRDDDGPIFPVGDVDARLQVQEAVVGIIVDGQAVAFPADAARRTLQRDGEVRFDIGGSTIELELDGGGLRALLDGDDVSSHQAFWFAWSQFHPDTDLWLP